MVIIIWVDLYGIGNARVVDPRSKLEDIKTIRVETVRIPNFHQWSFGALFVRWSLADAAAVERQGCLLPVFRKYSKASSLTDTSDP